MNSELTRRALIKGVAAICASALDLHKALAARDQESQISSLKAAAKHSGKLVAMFSGQYELMKIPVAAKTIATEFDMIAIGNDLKMNRIHPMPDAYQFSYGDYDVDWSQRNGLLFRGHTLVWHNALPAWFRSYVNKQNAERVMTDHITTVMKHYAGQIYSWDVVNEPMHADGRPDGLRVWPWLDLIGPDYLEIAFLVAAAADPRAKLVLNENNFDHDLPNHAQRRDTFLPLARRRKKNNDPVNSVGTQGHIRADIPFAA